jgi:hypothetical protein
MRSTLSAERERFGREWPPGWAGQLRASHGFDLSTSLLGIPLPHPIGKASGQLSLRSEQLQHDADAGLSFTVLKTVIGEDASGARTMGEWAIHETRMAVERRDAADGRAGWTVTWKGRGWDGTLAEYCALVESGRQLTKAGQLLVIPSVKLHLPPGGEEFREAEYAHTLGALHAAWGTEPLLLEHDFSPTLAGDARGREREDILRWIAELPGLIRSHADGPVRVALKLMNATFDDGFQAEMLRASASADAVTVFNRLWDKERQVAFGGWELSDRNLAVLSSVARHGQERSGTGNVISGRQIVAYAKCGCSTVQCHTAFQLPLREYAAAAGSRTARTLHRLILDPDDGLLAVMLEEEKAGRLHRHGGELRFRDLVTP